MELQPFEGSPVLSSGVTMPGASGGLNKALTVNGMELHKGDSVVLAVECTVAELRFPPVKDTDGVQRVHVLHVDNAAVIDHTVVAAALEAQLLKVEESKGVTRLPYADTDEAEDSDDPADDGPDGDVPDNVSPIEGQA
ncbi:MAG TPA: hypothetical protein VK507_04105 [Iamia sp.]|nr:hypothetical protein [Iamia sp.]